MLQSIAGLRFQFVWLVFAFGILADSALAGNYDGGIHVNLTCKKTAGGLYGNAYAANVANGKFAGRREFKRGQGGCNSKPCWTAWKGTIGDDGRFNMTIQENDWLYSLPYIGVWTLSGKFTTPDTATAKVVKFPRDWLTKCDPSTIALADPAPGSLAARGDTAPPIQAEDTSPPAATEKTEAAVQRDFRPALRAAKLLLRRVEAYAKSSNTIPNVIGIAQAVSKLKSAVKASEARSSEQRLGEEVEKLSGDLVLILVQDGNYAEFARKWDEAKKQSDAQSATMPKQRSIPPGLPLSSRPLFRPRPLPPELRLNLIRRRSQ
jgi:hypothetical protein